MGRVWHPFGPDAIRLVVQNSEAGHHVAGAHPRSDEGGARVHVCLAGQEVAIGELV